jgi:hypothetical protein
MGYANNDVLRQYRTEHLAGRSKKQAVYCVH